jgi:hypothetical protein
MDPPGEMLGWYLCPNAYKQKFFEINGKPWIILGRLIKAPCPRCGNHDRAPESDGGNSKAHYWDN